MSNISKSERIKQLKEVLKKKHDQETELKLKTTTDQAFNRFSKYRRSCGSVQSSNYIKRAVAISTSKDDSFRTPDPCRDPSLEGIKTGNVHELATSFESHQDLGSGKTGGVVELSPHYYAQMPDHKKSSYSPKFHSKSSDELAEGRQSPTTSRKRIPSILKRKDDNHSSVGASVSFDLDPTISDPIPRTKSTDSNISCDTETGYWSGGENLPSRILKSRVKSKDVQYSADQKSILKDRRASLGSTSSPPESTLHGILKRKLSYDSATILHGANSFSTNSLDCVTNSEPKPILKKKSSSEDLDEAEWTNPKPILKKQSLRGDHSHSSSSDGLDDSTIRPILKKSVHLEEKPLPNEAAFSSSSSGRGILKRTGRKGSSNYYSMEESLHFSSDRTEPENCGYYGYGVRHGSLPNPENAVGDLSNLTFQMEKNIGRTDSEEDIISTLTVAEKRSIFIQMEMENAKASSVRVEKRHATQPVTLDEIEKASQLMKQQISSIPIEQLKSSIMKEEPKQLLGTMLGELCERKNSTDAAVASCSAVKKSGPIPRSASIDSSTPLLHSTSSATGKSMTLLDVTTLKATESNSQEDPSKLSVWERVEMFNVFTSSASSSFCRSLKKPVTSKRFQTQPITDLEHRYIQSCVGIGPHEVKANVVDEFELLQAPKGSRREIDCGEDSSKAAPPSSEDDDEGSDGDMHDNLRCRGVASVRASSSDADDEQGVIDDQQDQSFLKKRVKSPTYEISDMEVDAGLCEKSGNIAAKIAALKTNGEMNWKKRICKPIIKNVLVDDEHRNIEITANNKDSPSVIANRLSLLTKSQTGWKQRVSENDATDLTVQSKLEKAGKLKESSILCDKKSKALNNILTPTTFASKGNKTPALTQELEKRLNVVKKLQHPPTASPVSRLTTAEVPTDAQAVRNVSVSEIDTEAFRKFFPSPTEIFSGSPSTVPPVNFSLDDITSTNRQFLGVRRNVRLNRNHAAVRNPIKSLASRLPEQSYTELTPEVREKELKKRIQVENLSKTSHLSVEALAGLVSKEDFTAVKLKRAEKEPRSQEIPYPMLIRIKGKRFVQSRLVPPLVSSLSSGDCFILITKDKVYQYVGEFSNRMEKNKLADILTHLMQKRDLGIKLNSIAAVATIEAPFAMEREDVKNFFKALGGAEMASEEADVLGDAADEAYESGVIRTNRVFEVDPVKEQLIPLLADGGWGSQPKFSILKEDKVLVFDFGSEMYVWSGCRADPNLKRTGTLLAREMFEDSYNFSEVGHEYSPLGPQLTGDKRPNWCWFKRVTHHMEPILFIEKFFDWPDESGKLIRIKTISESSSGKEGGFNFTPCDVQEMMDAANSIEDPVLDLEGFNVSRGTDVHDEKEHRHYVITTLEVTAWRISEFSKTPIDAQSLGHFYSTETYVVRWHYSVMQTGRDLKGNQSKHGGVMGRARTAYFFWHGKDSKATEQGTSALMTVELDEEKGPQVRVVQGREPPAFLALFDGLMFIHLGSPEECAQRNLRVYVTMGCLDKEGHFVEVSADPSSFRSRGSFLVVDRSKGNFCLWHGCHTSPTTEKIAQKGAKYISTSPSEIGLPKPFRTLEMREGEETKEVWERLGLKSEMEWRESYTSLRAQANGSSQITVFQFTTLNGIFEAHPLLSPKRKMDTLHLFSVLQEDLYNVRQPAIFLVTHGSDVWLWHGWIPRGDEENENTSTGSGEYRWAAERKAALDTIVNLVKHKNGRGFLVHAGLEPPLFRCLFPYWSTNQEARECNLADGKLEDGAISLSAALELFKKKTYTLQEIQERPEGVDLLRLEDYLCDSDFLSLLKMSRDDFGKLQQWRKTEIKKQVGLF